jgi:hypothetical protein
LLFKRYFEWELIAFVFPSMLLASTEFLYVMAQMINDTSSYGLYEVKPGAAFLRVSMVPPPDSLLSTPFLSETSTGDIAFKAWNGTFFNLYGLMPTADLSLTEVLASPENFDERLWGPIETATKGLAWVSIKPTSPNLAAAYMCTTANCTAAMTVALDSATGDFRGIAAFLDDIVLLYNGTNLIFYAGGIDSRMQPTTDLFWGTRKKCSTAQ